MWVAAVCSMPSTLGFQVRPPSSLDHHATAERFTGPVSPHLGPGKIVNAADRGPDATLHRRVEDRPIGGVLPLARNAAAGGFFPGLPALAALEQTEVGEAHEPMIRIEGIEVNAVGGQDIQARRHRAAIREPARIDALPGLAAVARAHGAAEVGAETDVRIHGGDAEGEGILAPTRTIALVDPGILYVRCRGRRPCRARPSATFSPHRWSWRHPCCVRRPPASGCDRDTRGTRFPDG